MDLNKLLQEVIEQAKAINIPIREINPNILVNPRPKNRHAQCRREFGWYKIEISVHLKQAPIDKVKQTLAHEILHTCPNCMNHGDTWIKYANMMNRAYGYNIKRTTEYSEFGITKEPSKYTIVCCSCKKEINRVKKSKLVEHPEYFRCTCGGELKRKEKLRLKERN